MEQEVLETRAGVESDLLFVIETLQNGPSQQTEPTLPGGGGSSNCNCNSNSNGSSEEMLA